MHVSVMKYLHRGSDFEQLVPSWWCYLGQMWLWELEAEPLWQKQVIGDSSHSLSCSLLPVSHVLSVAHTCSNLHDASSMWDHVVDRLNKLWNCEPQGRFLLVSPGSDILLNCWDNSCISECFCGQHRRVGFGGLRCSFFSKTFYQLVNLFASVLSGSTPAVCILSVSYSFTLCQRCCSDFIVNLMERRVIYTEGALAEKLPQLAWSLGTSVAQCLDF